MNNKSIQIGSAYSPALRRALYLEELRLGYLQFSPSSSSPSMLAYARIQKKTAKQFGNRM